MDSTPLKESYLKQLENLREIIGTINSRIIADIPDTLICENVNFFSKSFLVTMCAYLESYLKDSLMVIIVEMNNRLKSAALPYNLIKWSLNTEKELKDSELKYEELSIKINRKQLDDFISGNPYRTRELFKKFGLNLEKNKEFKYYAEQMNALIIKRNKILHHNDDASDVSYSDLLNYIETTTCYIKSIDHIVCQYIAPN